MTTKTTENDRMKKIFAIMMVAVLAFALPKAVQAQCTPTFNGAPFTPSTELHLGESACINLCAFSFVAFALVGADLDEAGVPVLLTAAGCSPTNSNCDQQCDPIDPPTLFTLGGGIYFPDPNAYGGYSDCMEIIYRHNHDGVWEIEIFSLCEGCFCLTFDDQLAAEVSNFDAVAGDSKVTLSFTTVSETDLDRFNVLRDGVKQTEIAATNSASGHSYSWVDNNVINGVSYTYTLESVDLNGNAETLGATSATPNASASVVSTYALEQNFPNPFNPETNISFELAEATNVSLRVFNLLGQEVASLVNGPQAAGRHTVSFDGSNLTSGMYVYRLEAGEFSATRKMVLMK
jgi:hypothetical protein